MNGHIKIIIKALTLKPKIVFLIDGLGAFLTALFLNSILKTFNEYFGMPLKTLTLLSIIALIFAIYSLSCFVFSDNNSQKLLRPIIVANLTYCILTIGLVIYFYSKLTTVCISYFVGEILIISGLIYIEIKTLKVCNQRIRS